MLVIKKEFLDKVISQGKKGFPKEVCGILAGKNNTVEAVYEMQNTSEDAIHCYFMDPKEQLKVMKEIRNKNLEMLAIYHSHSQSPAYPSGRDIELAYYPESLYIIVSLEDFDKPVIRAFRIVEGEINEEEIIIR